MAQRITIVSVYHNALSRRLLELNYDITKRLNPHAEFFWLAADSTPAGFAPQIDAQKFTIIPNHESYGGLGSHQHAGGINKCLKEVKTRFVISLDSDFYILRREWIDEMLCYMQGHDLAFFGATYHAKDYPKYRYFPSVVCLCVDLEKVPLATLDFSPQLEVSASGKVVSTEKDRDRKKKKLRKQLKRFMPKCIAWRVAQIMRTFGIRRRRLVIGMGRDTGYRIFARYAHDASRGREYFQTVFDPKRDRDLQGRVWLPLNRLYERFLPDRLCYVPKNKQSYTRRGFGERGYTDLLSNGWEEYVWQDAPFGAHIRGSKTWKRNPSEDAEMELIRQALNSFL